jgi:hypothetical protein
MMRARFVLGAVMAASAAGCLPAAVDSTAADPAAQAEPVEETQSAAVVRRPGVAAHYALMLDGTMMGWLHSAEGGHAIGDVITTKVGATGELKKHIGGVKYEDIKVTVGAGMAPQFWQWIDDVVNHKPTRRDGAIVATDVNHREVSRLEFQQALLTEIGFPALDAASDDLARLSLTISPDKTRGARRSGDNARLMLVGTKQKRWTARNFRLAVDGVDTAHINKVEALTIKQKVVEYRDGTQPGLVRKVPGELELPNLAVQVPDRFADSWFDWHESFVVQGNADAGHEKTGRLEYLAEDLKEVLFTLDFHGLGIFKAEPDGESTDGDQPPKDKAEMYVDAVSLSSTPKN